MRWQFGLRYRFFTLSAQFFHSRCLFFRVLLFTPFCGSMLFHLFVVTVNYRVIDPIGMKPGTCPYKVRMLHWFSIEQYQHLINQVLEVSLILTLTVTFRPARVNAPEVMG